MTGFEVTVIASGVVTVLVIATLVVASLKFAERIKTLTMDYAALEQRFATLRENNQQELLAIGQRVLEADKLVRRFSERLDGIENNRMSDQSQYGQLQNLLTQTSAMEGDASAAETELLSLLTQRRKTSS